MDKSTREISQDASPKGDKSGAPLANINSVKQDLYRAQSHYPVQFYGGR